MTRVSGASGAAGADLTLQQLSADSAANNTTSLATVMTTTSVGAGTWNFKYKVFYRSAATTTGIAFAVNHTGTVTRFAAISHLATTGGAAANGVATMATSGTANLIEGKAQRTKNTSMGPFLGVDSANADCLCIIEGTVVVSVTGSLELRMASEVASSAVTVMANSTLELTKF